MVSTRVSRASALLLAIGGALLLFAPDYVLPRLVPNFPAAGAWIGQIVAASLLSLAALNWLSRSALLGGIYGRPVVLANAAFYFIAATSMLRAAARDEVPDALWVVALPVTLFAVVYSWLLFRGPVELDLQASRGAAGA